MFRGVLKALIACLLVTGAVSALAPNTQEPVQASLVAEHGVVAPGQTTQIAVRMQVASEWHVYWTNPGQSGFPTELQWDLPEGFSIGKQTWSAPQRFEEQGQVCFGYAEEFVVVADLIAPKTVEVDHVHIGASLTWLACHDTCMPGGGDVHLDLPIGQQGAPMADWVALMEQHQAMLPIQGAAVAALVEADTLHLRVDAAGEAKEAYFFPDHHEAYDYAARHELRATEEGIALGVPLSGTLARDVSGVLVVTPKEGGSVHAYHVATMLPVAKGSIAMKTLLFTLLMAFGGGLILNLMPCVLPVISLKVFQFMNLAGSKRSHAFKHGALFTAGVVVSFWVLAGVLLALRAYGESVGWGFQLQEPLFVVVLAAVLFLLGLSLLGVFELGTSLAALGGKQKRSGLLSSFMSGVLATVVATPCTGPLLAPALGFAVTMPPALAMVVFTVLALGMAAPYLLLSAFPGALKWLPKPGPWMVVFKQIMGFLMLATTLWLLWVFIAQIQAPTALILLLAALLVMGVAAWLYGRFGTPIQKRPVRWVARLAALSLLVFGGFVAVEQAKATPTVMDSGPHGDWLSWDPSQLADLRASGTPVFVDFTAKWCLICQSNKMPMHSSQVHAIFQEYGVVKMEADWTRRDALITQELEKFGRSGVPLYVLYGVDGKPVVLPQLLTPELLVDAVKKAVTD